MKKAGLILAAVAAVMLAMAPATQQANATDARTLWQAWVQDMKQVRADVAARFKARMEKK